MNAAERSLILADIQNLAHREAENVDQLKFFLPLQTHSLALRPEIVVIRGGRGAGKSALFALLDRLKDSDSLRRFFGEDRIPDARWIDAFSQLKIVHPEVGVLSQLATGRSDKALRAFWLTHLLVRVSEELNQPLNELPTGIFEALRKAKGNPLAWVAAAEEDIGAIGIVLDEFERRLASRGQTVFAAYDHLDRIGAFEPEVRRRYVGTLLALWLSLSNRYKHLRAKIFIREDLFDAGQLGFPDASKLRPRSVSIDWDVEALYRVAVRHIANISTRARDWLGDTVPLADRKKFGLMPGPMPEAVQKAFADRLAGELMGKGVKKGYTYRWIPNRMQDSQVRIVPRSMLSLIGFAAEDALRSPLSKGSRLLAPQNLSVALQSTSRERVNEIKEEYRLVQRIENLRGLTVLLERDTVVAKLSKPVTGEEPGLTIDGEVILDELIRLGVLSGRPDGRIDVPDIYRYGYGILRKGGVKTPR